MGLRAGKLDQRVTVQRRTRTTDAQKGGSVVWANVSGLVNLPAMVEARDREGSEASQADQITAVLPWRVTIRYSTLAATITAKDRLTWGSRTVQIESVRPGGMRMREFLEIAGSERAA